LCGPATGGLFPTGRDAAAEIEAAREAWTFDAKLHPSLTTKDSHIVGITNLRQRAPRAARAP
jgi:hypothetical protein